MKPIKRSVAFLALVLAVAVTIAGVYSLNSMREEAYRQADLDMERRIKTFWELVRTKGDSFSIRENKLMIGNYQVNDNFELPDKVKDIFGGTATIFMGDLRVSTNVPRGDGSRAVGTRLEGPAYDAIFRQGKPYRGEAKILGTPYLTAYDPILDANGKVIGVLYVGVEKGLFLRHYNNLLMIFLVPVLFLAAVAATLYLMLMKEAKESEQAQTRSLDFLQTLIDALPMPVFFKDARGVYVGCNTAFEVTFNTSREKIVGQNVHDLLGPELAEFFTEKDRELFS